VSQVSPPLVVILLATLLAGVIDAWKFKIHNLLTLPLILAGFIYHVVAGGMAQGWAGAVAGLTGSLVGALFGFGILTVFFVLGGMGAGDVKLMAGVGAWLGWAATFYVFVASSLAAGMYALTLLLIFGKWRATLLNLGMVWRPPVVLGTPAGTKEGVAAKVKQPDRREQLVPFGMMVALGLMALMAASWLGLT